MQQTIQVYEDENEHIREGDMFTVHVKSIDGRKVVELVKERIQPND